MAADQQIPTKSKTFNTEERRRQRSGNGQGERSAEADKRQAKPIHEERPEGIPRVMPMKKSNPRRGEGTLTTRLPEIAEIEVGDARVFSIWIFCNAGMRGNSEVRRFLSVGLVVRLSRRVRATSKKLISSNEPSFIHLHFVNQIITRSADFVLAFRHMLGVGFSKQKPGRQAEY
jgi:hypothetical protein